MKRNAMISMRLYGADMAALNALSKVSKMTPSTIARYLMRAGLAATADLSVGDLRERIITTEAEATAKQMVFEEQHPEYEIDLDAQRATVASVIDSA